MISINISEIAKMAGVSKSTVSRVLNGHPDVMPQTRQLIKDIIKEVDYHPKAYAKAISSQRSNTICLVLPYSPSNTFSNPYYTDVFRGVLSITQERGYQTIIMVSGQGDYVRAAKEQSADGIIFINAVEADRDNIKELTEMDFPIMAASRTEELPEMCNVCIDDYKAAQLAIEYLVKNNHRHIGMINLPKDFASGEIRLRGYKDTLEKHRIPFRKEYIVTCSDVMIENGLLAMQSLMNYPEITAVFVTDDLMAIGAVNAIHKAGKKVPDDYSVIGFDDHPLSRYVIPSLTTIRHDAVGRGGIAATMLIDRIQGEEIARNHIMDVELIPRESTKTI